MASTTATLSRRIRFLMATGAIAGLTTATGCSPLGWYDDPAPHKRAASNGKKSEYRKAPKRYGKGTPKPQVGYDQPETSSPPPADVSRRDGGEPEPAPVMQAPTRIKVSKPKATQKPAIQIVETGRKGTYYLIDRKRQLCFFHNGGAVARIECSTLPEASDFAKREAPAQPDRPSQPERQATKDARPSPPPPQPAEPAPAEPKKFKGSQKGHAAGSDHDPTGDEAARFTAAYVAIFCDRQSGKASDPRTTIQRHGLSVERYSEIEGWMAKDERRWRSLTQAALKGCEA